MYNGQWTLLDENGGTALTFTSFIGMNYRNDGQTLSYPIELGSFADYNKIQKPLHIGVTLGVQGLESDFAYALARLDLYKKEAVKLSVVTPSSLYESFTLENYDYNRQTANGAGMLVAELSLVEVREVQTQVMTGSVSWPQNPTSALNVNTGKTQAILWEAAREVLGRLPGIPGGSSLLPR